MADYGTLAGFRTYHTARGRVTTAYNDTAVDAAKLIASEWIDNRYRASFGGFKVALRAQVREWPRTAAYDVNGYVISTSSVPTEVENATYEATLKQLADPGSLSVDWVPPKYRRASVDGAVSVEYNIGLTTASDAQTRFKIVDEILMPILTGRGTSAALSGPAYRA